MIAERNFGMRKILLISAALCLSLACGFESLADDEATRFVRSVQPLLFAKCVSCHGPEKQEGNLRLDSLAAAREGGDQGLAIVPGDVDKSLLVTAISFRDPDLQMPPRQKLTNKEIATLTEWVKSGAAWPDPATVLFEDDPQFLAALTSGNGKGRINTQDVFSGKAALGITPLQRDGVKILGWQFVVREKPQFGEYRYLRLGWKKRGEGSLMIELARNGSWPDPKDHKGRYVAGPNTTGWAAISVRDAAPKEWTVATFDLWKDIGDFTLTGIAPTCDRGEEAFFDSIILGSTIASLDVYRPGAGSAKDSPGRRPLGDAFTDKRNPIRRIFGGERLDLWSLKKPVRPDIPAGAKNPIDGFIQSQLAGKTLTRSTEADRRTLIRRLTFDLTGLPPTSEEVLIFVADRSSDAYDKLVTRLLNSLRYGERQARLWLDVVRYADTNGYERDEFRPLAWQYRDYVIRSFNQDKPFDQFIREQLAGDERVHGPPKSSAEVDALIATGYLRLGQWDSTASIFQEEPRLRAEMMADLTNTTASAFLGLTMSCCQCHDHKFDPLLQADHFRLRAFFAGVTPRDDLSISLVEELAEIDRHNARIDEQVQPLKVEQGGLDKGQKSRHKDLEKQISELESKKQQPHRAMGATDAGSSAPATHILYQGDFSSPREKVSPGFVSVLSPGPAPIQSPRTNTTGRRLTLANWIASPENPWTARVIVNRIWQQHFGTGLVATPNDFGYTGARPSHPELLDWLAIEFLQCGWSIKELHRLIVTSETYRQTSHQSVEKTAAGEVDPDNTLLWRQNMRRLDAETLRDSLLAVSGRMQPYEGGKPRWPNIPDELLYAQPAILEAIEGKDGGRRQGWYTDPVQQTDVRSVYLVRKRCLPIPFLQAFDLPDTTVSCARRDTTVVAPQALMLLNSPDSVRYALSLAERITAQQVLLDLDNSEPIGQLIEALFQRALCRSATKEERTLAAEFLQRHRDHHVAKVPADQAAKLALTDLCRAVLNLNEFVYID
jgi:hypothetical protein